MQTVILYLEGVASIFDTF